MREGGLAQATVGGKNAQFVTFLNRLDRSYRGLFMRIYDKIVILVAFVMLGRGRVKFLLMGDGEVHIKIIYQH